MSYNIPLFDLNYDERESQAVIETLSSKWISMGPKTEELEELFRKKWNVKYAAGVANCTAGLHLACIAVGLNIGDEVICPSLTFAATANAIKYTGATPVFCDINSVEDITINAEKIEESITDKTKAIVVMHFAGFPCDMDTVMKIARDHHLYVIEDACHGPLSEYHGKKLGTIGDVGVFSFFSNKNISTGEGGAVITNNESLYLKIKAFRSHGMTTMSYQRASGHASDYDITMLGYNYRIDDIHSSLAIVQIEKLESDYIKRVNVRNWYERELRNIEGIIVPFCKNKEYVSNYIFPTVMTNGTISQRNSIREYLHKHGIQTSVHYPAVHRFSIYRESKNKLPVTEYVSDHEITLPMYAKLTEEQVCYICDIYKSAIKMSC